MTALQHMVAILLRSDKWIPDRFERNGPSFKVDPKPHRDGNIDRNHALKARVLTELERGKATSDEIAKRLHMPQQEVGAKLSRLYADGHVERALSAISPHTGRRVLLYWIRHE